MADSLVNISSPFSQDEMRAQAEQLAGDEAEARALQAQHFGANTKWLDGLYQCAYARSEQGHAYKVWDLSV